MIVAIWSTRSSSNAAEVKIGWGKEVAKENSPPVKEKLTPGLPATPWRASDQKL
jgi:hypothetical protein